MIRVGAELSLALEATGRLRTKHGIQTRVVSFPCQRLFEQQCLGYRCATLQRHLGIPAVVIEPYTPNGWEMYADAVICLTRFGHSLPGKEAYDYFGFSVEKLIEKMFNYLNMRNDGEFVSRKFVEL